MLYVLLLFTSCLMNACGFSSLGNTASTTPSQPISVTVAPTQAVVQIGRTQQFTVTVTGATNSAVQWFAGGVAGGDASVGTISAGGLYTAPSAIPSGGSVTVTATSQADRSESASASVQVTEAPTVGVSILPIQVNLQAGQTQQFTATVTGTSNTAVTWLAGDIVGGNASVGTVSTTGLYTAPASISQVETVTVTALSSYDPNASATASITLGQCGPPTYACSRTDLAVTQPDAGQPLNFGGIRGVNTTVTDLVYNNVRITRCTDGYTNPNNLYISYLAGLGGSPGGVAWNADDTQLILGDVSGEVLLMRFDADAGTCSPITTASGDLFQMDPAVFSRNDPAGGPYTIYDFGYPTSLKVSSISSPSTGPPVCCTTIADFANALYQSNPSSWPGASQNVAFGSVIVPASNNPSQWAFQAVTAGTTGSSEPDWSASTIPQSNLASNVVSDGSVTWRNVDTLSTATVYVDPGGVESAGDRYIGMSVGFNPNGQDYGVWALVYDRINNTFYQFNTWTGIESDFTCAGGSGIECTGGTWTPSTPVQTSNPDRFTWHENGLVPGGQKFAFSVSGTCNCQNTPTYEVWTPGTASLIPMVPYGEGHPVFGYSHFANMDTADGASDYYLIRPYTAPSDYTALWAPNPCTDTNQTLPPYPYPPCYPVFDTHLSWNYNRGSDEEPPIGAADEEYVDGSYPAVSPWQYEIIGVSTQQVWRFGRTFNFGTDANFYSAISSGTVSQTGKFYALTSTGNGTVGSSAGGSSCYGGYSWSPGFDYAASRQITPVNYNNPAFYTFQASAACTSGQSEPTWSQDGITPVSDGSCTWKPAGVYNCRSDVLIFGLQ